MRTCQSSGAHKPLLPGQPLLQPGSGRAAWSSQPKPPPPQHWLDPRPQHGTMLFPSKTVSPIFSPTVLTSYSPGHAETLPSLLPPSPPHTEGTRNATVLEGLGGAKMGCKPASENSEQWPSWLLAATTDLRPHHRPGTILRSCRGSPSFRGDLRSQLGDETHQLGKFHESGSDRTEAL